MLKQSFIKKFSWVILLSMAFSLFSVLPEEPAYASGEFSCFDSNGAAYAYHMEFSGDDVTVYKWNVAAGSYTTSETFDLGGLTGSTDQINGHTMDGDGNMYVIYQPTSGNKHLVKLNYVDGEEQFADALVLYFEGAYNHYRTKGPLTQEEIKYLDNYISVCTGN